MAYLYTKNKEGSIVRLPLGGNTANNNTDNVFLLPIDFGAQGTGKVDDSLAMTACINEAYSKRMPIYLNKPYLCDNLIIDKHVTFIGDNPKWNNVENNITSKDYGLCVSKDKTITITSPCDFIGVGIKGNLLIKTSRVHFDRCVFYSGQKAIELLNETNDWHGEITWKDCAFCLCETAIYVNPSNVSYHDCEISGCTVIYGDTFLSGYLSGWNINGNHIYSSCSIDTISSDSFGISSTIMGNNYFDCRGTALKLKVRGKVSITGSMFYNPRKPDGYDGVSIIPCILATKGNNNGELTVTSCIWNTSTVEKENRTFIENIDNLQINTDNIAPIQTDVFYKTPYDYGAVGDGVADDTEAIQALIDNNNFCYFPIGLWRVTKSIKYSRKNQNPDFGHLQLKGESGLLNAPTDITPNLLKTYSKAYSIIWGDFSAYDEDGNVIKEERSVVDIDGTCVSFTAVDLMVAATIANETDNSFKDTDPKKISMCYHYKQTHETTNNASTKDKGIYMTTDSYGLTKHEFVDDDNSGHRVVYLTIEESRAYVLENGKKIDLIINGISATRQIEMRRCTFAGFSGAGIKMRMADTIRPQHAKFQDIKLLSCYNGMELLGHDHLLEHFWVCRCHDAFHFNDAYNNSNIEINNTWADQLYNDFIYFKTAGGAWRFNNCYIDLIGGRFIHVEPDENASNYNDIITYSSLAAHVSNTRMNKVCLISGDAAISVPRMNKAYISLDSADTNWIGNTIYTEKPLFEFISPNPVCKGSTIICPRRSPQYIYKGNQVPSELNTIIDSSGLWMTNDHKRYGLSNLITAGSGETI